MELLARRGEDAAHCERVRQVAPRGVAHMWENGDQVQEQQETVDGLVQN